MFYHILLFQSDIDCLHKVAQITGRLDDHGLIAEWSVDTTDIDNVLRIVASPLLSEEDVIEMLREIGFHCEVLPDEIPTP